MSPPVTRWSARLLDREQEHQFARYNLREQRHTAFVTLLTIVCVNVGVFVLQTVFGHGDLAPLHLVTQLVVTLVGGGFAIGLVRERSHAVIVWLVVGGSLAMSAMVTLLIVVGRGMDFRGAILVIGGVAVIYLVVPLTLLGVTACATAYSAMTIPAWLSQVSPESNVDVRYVGMSILLAHGLGFVAARRVQYERRVLFAQRDTLLALSSIDPLTGLMNRRAVDAEMARAWHFWRDGGVPLSVIMIDIDHFKRLNDSQGHVVGDHALRLVADVIRNAMPLVPGQVAARYGGEEFICLLPGLDATEATVVAGRILAGVRRVGIPLALSVDDRMILTVSAGVAAAEPAMTTAESLVAAADGQLYRAKAEGRNCVRAVAQRPPARRLPSVSRSVPMRSGYRANSGSTRVSSNSTDRVE